MTILFQVRSNAVYISTGISGGSSVCQKKGGGGLRLVGFRGFKKLLLAVLPILDFIKYVTPPPQKKKIDLIFFQQFYSFLFNFFITKGRNAYDTRVCNMNIDICLSTKCTGSWVNNPTHALSPQKFGLSIQYVLQTTFFLLNLQH